MPAQASTPRLISIFGKAPADVPASLAQPLAASTGPDGKATLNYLAARDLLMAVRVTADAIGTQDILLIERPGVGSEAGVITIKLKPTTHLAGRVVDQDGHAVVDHAVEVWSRGGGGLANPEHGRVQKRCRSARAPTARSRHPINSWSARPTGSRFAKRAKIPSFRTGSPCRAKPRDLSPFVLRPLRTVRGQVVDRQGKPVAGVEVFQSGDGPERTSAKTDADGRFSLGGFRQGPGVSFARGDGFRFQGRLIKPAESDVTVELTRVSEHPSREMKMLPDPIPFEESRALARRLVEPLWATVAADGEDNAKYSVLSRLSASIRPAFSSGSRR